MKLIHQEKEEGILPIARGKCNWIDEDTSRNQGLETFIFSSGTITQDDIISFKIAYIRLLKSKGFVFFDDDKTVYRLMKNRNGRIVEFAVNYMKID